MAERWKEEVIRVTEEMRRLGAWHEYKVRHFEKAVNEGQEGESWVERGRHAILQERLEEWKGRLAKLPVKIRVPPSTGVDLDGTSYNMQGTSHTSPPLPSVEHT